MIRFIRIYINGFDWSLKATSNTSPLKTGWTCTLYLITYTSARDGDNIDSIMKERLLYVNYSHRLWHLILFQRVLVTGIACGR